MYIVPSGNILEGIIYQVKRGNGSVDYNGTTYSEGSFFTGVDGVTTYSGGDVIYASIFRGGSVGYDVPALYYSPNELFPFNDSYFRGQSVGYKKVLPKNNYNVYEGYNISPLRFTNYQDTLLHNRYYYSKVMPSLYADKNSIIPFQFIVTSSGEQIIQSVKLANVETGEVIDLSVQAETKVDLIELSGRVFNVVYNGEPFDTDIPFGTYEIQVQMINVKYVSELITIVPDYYFAGKKDIIKLKWWNDNDWEQSNGTIVYSTNGYYHQVYLMGDLLKPDYKEESESVERQGEEFFIEQYTEKQFNVPLLVTEPVLDSLRLMPLHDHAQITSRGITYDMYNIEFDFEWENNDLANLNLKFDSGEIFKRI